MGLKIPPCRDNPAMGHRHLLMLLAVAAFIPPAHAQWLGWPPKPAAPTVSEDSAPPAAAVRLRFTGQGPWREVWVESDLSGPVEVRIDSPQAREGFPIRRTLPARGRWQLARLPANASLSLHLTAVPGTPAARAVDIGYLFPLRLPQVSIGQLPQGRFSHGDAENRHAIDFAAPIGTPVIAARAGVVMQVEGRFGDRPGHLDEANFVRVLHADGSMAIYAHLQRDSLQVAAGQRVEAGTLLARSGNSGYSSGPHLHFAVQVNRGMRLESIPVRIQTPVGELQLPRGQAQR